MNSVRQIKLGIVLSYITIAINVLAGLIYTPWMIVVIGKNNYGLYVLATSLISMFLLDFGMSAAVTRFISKYNAEGDQQSVNNVVGVVFRLFLIVNAFVLLILVIIFPFLDLIYVKLTPDELSRFKVVYIIAATYSIVSFSFSALNGILISYEKFIELKTCDLLNRLMTVLLIVLALLSDYGLYAVVAVNAITGLITIGLKLIIIKRKTTIKVNFKYKNKTLLKDIFNYSTWSTAISISQRLIFNVTPSILGAMSNSASIAIFGISSILEGFVFTFASAINSMFLPKVSRMVAKENSTENILQLMIKIGRIQLAIIGLIVIGFVSVGKEFIFLWMGEDYLMVYYCTLALILPSLISLPQEIANITIIAVNKVKLQAYVFMGMGAINIVISLIMSYFWGAFGSSCAIGISYFICSIAMNFVYYQALNIDVFRFFEECHLKLSVPLLVALIIATGIQLFFPVAGWYGFIIKVILIVTSYTIIMWGISFNEFERSLLIGAIRIAVKKTSSRQ